MLALPAKTLAAGFVPSSGALFLCWVYMAASGLLIAEVNVNTLCATPRCHHRRAATAAAPPPHRRADGGLMWGPFFALPWRSIFGPHVLVFWTQVLVLGALAAYGR